MDYDGGIHVENLSPKTRIPQWTNFKHVTCKYHIRCDARLSVAFPKDYSEHFCLHDDAIKWKHFRRYWPFVWGIHPSPMNSQHKGQWRGALIFSLICVWINGWVNNRDAGDLRRYRVHYGGTVMNLWWLKCKYKSLKQQQKNTIAFPHDTLRVM